jgi:hypothetical protein
MLLALSVCALALFAAAAATDAVARRIPNALSLALALVGLARIALALAAAGAALRRLASGDAGPRQAVPTLRHRDRRRRHPDHGRDDRDLRRPPQAARGSMNSTPVVSMER